MTTCTAWVTTCTTWVTTPAWPTMVLLTPPAAMRMTQGLGRKADDLMLGKRYGRFVNSYTSAFAKTTF